MVTVMNALVKERSIEHLWHIDSAGTSNYHCGDSPDHRTVEICRLNPRTQHTPVTHRGRRLLPNDFQNFDYILYMDESNGINALEIAPKSYKAKLQLLGYYDPMKKDTNGTIVRDPYYDHHNEGFEFAYKLITRSLENFINQIQETVK